MAIRIFLIIISMLCFNIPIFSTNAIYSQMEGTLESGKIKFWMFIDKFEGILLYSVDSKGNHFAIEATEGRFTEKFICINFNNKISHMTLRQFCSCDPCEETLNNFMFTFGENSIVAICNHNRHKSETRWLPGAHEDCEIQKKNVLNPRPVLQNEKMLIIMGYIQSYTAYAKLQPIYFNRALSGCLTLLYYNEKQRFFTEVGSKSANQISNCQENCNSTICNKGSCHQNLYDMVCKCESINLNGRYCNKGLEKYVRGERDSYDIVNHYEKTYMKLTWQAKANQANYCLLEIVGWYRNHRFHVKGDKLMIDNEIIGDVDVTGVNFIGITTHIDTSFFVAYEIKSGKYQLWFYRDANTRINIGFSETDFCKTFIGNYDVHLDSYQMRLRHFPNRALQTHTTKGTVVTLKTTRTSKATEVIPYSHSTTLQLNLISRPFAKNTTLSSISSRKVSSIHFPKTEITSRKHIFKSTEGKSNALVRDKERFILPIIITVSATFILILIILIILIIVMKRRKKTAVIIDKNMGHSLHSVVDSQVSNEIYSGKLTVATKSSGPSSFNDNESNCSERISPNVGPCNKSVLPEFPKPESSHNLEKMRTFNYSNSSIGNLKIVDSENQLIGSSFLEASSQIYSKIIDDDIIELGLDDEALRSSNNMHVAASTDKNIISANVTSTSQNSSSKRGSSLLPDYVSLPSDEAVEATIPVQSNTSVRPRSPSTISSKYNSIPLTSLQQRLSEVNVDNSEDTYVFPSQETLSDVRTSNLPSQTNTSDDRTESGFFDRPESDINHNSLYSVNISVFPNASDYRNSQSSLRHDNATSSGVTTVSNHESRLNNASDVDSIASAPSFQTSTLRNVHGQNTHIGIKRSN